MDTLDHQKDHKGVLEQMKPETLLEEKMTIQKLSYFECVMRGPGSLKRQ